MANIFETLSTGLGWTGKSVHNRETTTTASSAAGGATIPSKAVRILTNEQALNVAAAYACVDLICNTVAGIPLIYKTFNPQKQCFLPFDWGFGEGLSYALTVRPNRRMTAYQFRYLTCYHLLMQGNAYIVPIKDTLGDVAELRLVHPSYVNFDEFSNRYYITDTYQQVSGQYSPDDIIHIRLNCFGWSQSKGISPIEFARQTMSIGATIQKSMLNKLGKDGMGKMLVGNKDDQGGSLDNDDEEILNFADDLQEQVNEGRDIFALRGQIDVKQMQFSAADLQFIQMSEKTQSDICAIFHVPPSKIGIAGKNASYKTPDADNAAYYAQAIRPILDNIEAEYTAKLIERKQVKYYKFTHDVSSIMATDLNTQADYQKKRIESGTLTINEARKLNDMPIIDGGDVVLVSTNMAGLGSDKINNKEKDGKEQ